MPILNYTTKIDAHKTIAEIQKILNSHGAFKITIDYQNSIPSNLTFGCTFNGINAYYSLPCEFKGVLNAMKEQGVPRSYQNEDQAIRTGWRILKDWVEAQMAIVEAKLATLPQIFLPYSITRNGDTLYDYIKSLDENNSPLMLTQ